MSHIVLLGDSIFDNARYVPGRPPVIEQLRRRLPAGWLASLLAVDGHTAEDVPRQLARQPADATHLVVSAGGNDALGESSLLNAVACTVGDALAQYQDARRRFQTRYRAMLDALAAAARPTVVCTVYDAIPGLEPAELAALAGFNEIILREAFRAGVPVLDLRIACDQAADYSHVSRIEPSATGGSKITRLIAEVVTTHDFRQPRSTVYA